MKIVHIVNIFAAVVLLAAAASVSVAVWAARQSDLHNYRISLAHTSFEHHLKLAADTYLLFKRFGDLLLADDTGQVADITNISNRLQTHITNIRAAIEQEIELVGDEELAELMLLDKIEEIIDDILDLYRRAQSREAADGIGGDWREVSLALNEDIKEDFRTLISTALTEEQEEVSRAEAEASAKMALVRMISFGLAVAFLCITAIALIVFRREFTRPLRQLLGGVRQFAAGDFSSRIALPGRSELSEIAGVLDEMSAVVSARTKNLTTQNEELEQAVRQRTETLEKLLTEARKSEQNRRQLLADVSHELRTPLTVIQGESDVALRGADKTVEEYKDALTKTRLAANHTANLISDLLFIARKESGSLELVRKPVDLIRLIHEVIALCGAEVGFEPQRDKVIVIADGQRIRQAVLALLENAKYHGGDMIAVTLQTHGDIVEIAVSDDGPGVDNAEKELAFERFFRGSNASGRYIEGLGLGLPIVRSIAEAHGGSARIFDRPTGGTTVVLTISTDADP
ncbi:HAMP domain-containing sensor histidine kinase [Phaeobacter sp. JH20_02]|uniref:sensor histidine kinase n=1 Tax=unclassified Phaeobacter TaxID=2621772 RepID=UPI003A8796A0